MIEKQKRQAELDEIMMWDILSPKLISEQAKGRKSVYEMFSKPTGTNSGFSIWKETTTDSFDGKKQ